MNRTLLVALLGVLLASCEGADRSLISSSVALGTKPFVLVPDRPLATPAHINQLCVAVPPEYHTDIDSMTLRSDSGADIRLSATLIDTNGGSHSFTHQSFLFSQRHYVCLSPESPEKPGVRYREVSISSSAPLRTEEIRWISTDKL